MLITLFLFTFLGCGLDQGPKEQPSKICTVAELNELANMRISEISSHVSILLLGDIYTGLGYNNDMLKVYAHFLVYSYRTEGATK